MLSGDNSSVLFCLSRSQDGLFHDCSSSVPNSVAALRSGVSPQTLVKVLHRDGSFGALTAKKIFVHLSYACLHVADAIRHVPVEKALAAPVLVLSMVE